MTTENFSETFLGRLQLRDYQCQHEVAWRTALVTAQRLGPRERLVAAEPEEGQSAVTTAALSKPSPNAPGVPLVPGELLKLVGEYLAEKEVPVRLDGDQLLVAPAARPRSKKQARETRAARCTLSIDDDATARLHFFPWAAETTDGHWLADVAAALLTGTAGTGQRHPDTASPAVTSVKATAGMDLRHRGFKVELNTYEDDYYLDVASDIAATAPGSRGMTSARGVVYLSDNGTACWERCYWYEHAVTGPGPELRSWLPDPSAVARAVAGTVTAAVRTAWPEPDAG